MAKYKRRQANSLWIDITCDNLTDIDANWTNWLGTWAIKDTAGTTTIMSGTLEKSGTVGKFMLRIGPKTTGWIVLPVGSYNLYTQIDNTTADYRFEDLDTLTITAQGIV